MLQTIQAFELRSSSADGEKAELWHRGARVGAIEGSVLEYQFATPGGFLLLTTAGRPFEESLYALWLDAHLVLADALELAAPYAAGLLTDVVEGPDAELRFSFFGGDRWHLRVLKTPRRPGIWSTLRPGFSSPVRRLAQSRSVQLELSREI